MRTIAALLPLPIILGLYACAAAGTSDDDVENDVLPATPDAASDASTVRRDSGPASPPKEAGASSSGDGGKKDSGTSSSSGGGSSSSGGGSGNVTQCTSDQKIAYGGLILAADPDLPPGFTKVDDCADCTGMSSAGCCAEFDLIPQGTYCVDPTGP